MITQDKVESALHYLATTGSDFAEAKGRRVWLEHKRKIVLADLMSQCEEKTNAAKEAWAYVQKEYQEVCDDLRDAVIAEETLRANRAAAESRIEVWRSNEATRRAVNV